MISTDSVPVQVSMNAKMAGHVKKSTSVKENNVKLSGTTVMGHTLRLRSSNIQNKQM
jgi:hypothetical protein